jgi:hypothetical protein
MQRIRSITTFIVAVALPAAFVRRRVQFLAKPTREWQLPFDLGSRVDGDMGSGLWTCSHSLPPYYAIRSHACNEFQLSRLGILWLARVDLCDWGARLASNHRRQSRHQRADGSHDDCLTRSDGRNKARISPGQSEINGLEPLVWAPVLGAILVLFGVKLPLAKASVSLIGETAGGTALFALGALC